MSKNKRKNLQQQRLIALAKNDYKELAKTVSNYSGDSLSELCKMLRGHNLNSDENLFDVNYGRICATIYQEEDGSFSISNYIEIWNEDEELEFFHYKVA